MVLITNVFAAKDSQQKSGGVGTPPFGIAPSDDLIKLKIQLTHFILLENKNQNDQWN